MLGRTQTPRPRPGRPRKVNSCVFLFTIRFDYDHDYAFDYWVNFITRLGIGYYFYITFSRVLSECRDVNEWGGGNE